MSTIKRKRWLFPLFGLLNTAVVVMFYVVNINVDSPPPPQPNITPSVVRSEAAGPATIPAVVGTPTRIVVPSLDIDLVVDVGSYDARNRTWTIGSANAYYADPSLPANDSNGRTLIYGHAQPQVFGRLPKIQPNAEAIVYTDNGLIFRYSYESVKEVIPTDTSVFSAEGPPTLILQTCTGDWDAYRGLFSFRFDSQEKL